MKKLDMSKVVYVLMMIIVFTISQAFGQITVTHFNAEWNSANKVEWFGKLDDCDLTDVDIVKEPNTLNILYRNPFLENNVTFSLEKENYINVCVSTRTKLGIPKPILEKIIQSKMKYFINETLSLHES